jgi:hypothetical protein
MRMRMDEPLSSRARTLVCSSPRHSCGFRTSRSCAQTSTSVWCRAHGRQFYVPREQLFGDEVRTVGDLGILVVPDWFARDHGFRV